MRFKKMLILSVVLAWFSMFTPSMVANAATQNNDMAYSVSAKLPASQINHDVSYFDLQLNPGSKETIYVHINNSSNERSTFTISPNQATTNKNGVIDYSKHKGNKDRSLKNKLDKIISPDTKTVTLEAGQQMDVPFVINMPKKEFKGIVLGGFYVQKKVKDTKASDKKVMIKNRYAFVIGLSIQNKSDAVTPDLKLLNAKAGLDNSYTTILANLQNPKATIIHKLNIDAKITPKGQKKVLYKTSKTQMAMAPNSNFNLPVSLNKNAIKPGKYTMHVKASAENGEYKWNLSKDFTIKSDEANKLNAKAVEVKKDYTWLIYVGIAVLLILIGVIVMLVLKLKRNKEGQVKNTDK